MHRRVFILLLATVSLTVVLYCMNRPDPVVEQVANGQFAGVEERESQATDMLPKKAILDISVHTLDGLRVLLDRAEQLAMTPRPEGEDASVVLVLHGPEIEFFSIRNYDRYRNIVDQAARLDAFDVVDVKICRTMMAIKGIPRDDIPSFIEQVPYGPAEIERLLRDGYVYF